MSLSEMRLGGGGADAPESRAVHLLGSVGAAPDGVSGGQSR